MTFNLSTILDTVKSLATIATAAKLVAGMFAQKLWSKLVGAEAKLAAEVTKLEAEVKAKL